MFCSNCGSNIADTAEACPHCGVKVPRASSAPQPEKFCRSCGSQIPADAATCMHCNETVGAAPAMNPTTGRSWAATLILCCLFFVTGLGGIHRFYTGHILLGVLQLVTFGGCGIWTIIDLVIILTDGYRDVDGHPLVK